MVRTTCRKNMSFKFFRSHGPDYARYRLNKQSEMVQGPRRIQLPAPAEKVRSRYVAEPTHTSGKCGATAVKRFKMWLYGITQLGWPRNVHTAGTYKLKRANSTQKTKNNTIKKAVDSLSRSRFPNLEFLPPETVGQADTTEIPQRSLSNETFNIIKGQIKLPVRQKKTLKLYEPRSATRPWNRTVNRL